MAFVSDKKKKKKIIFFGDSITQQGIEPEGYISILKNLFEHNGVYNYDLIGSGINGNKIYDLYLRIEEDVISKSPDIVLIFEGVNDVWDKTTHGTGTDLDKYEKFYRAVIQKLVASNIKIVLVTPIAIGEKKDNSNVLDENLDRYINIIKEIGSDLNLPVCDLRNFCLQYLSENNLNNSNHGILTTDGVHLNNKGNKLVAEQIWDLFKTVI